MNRRGDDVEQGFSAEQVEVVMDDGKGITEVFWSRQVNDDAKMMWRVASRGVTFLAALLLPKTGLAGLDIGVAVLTALIPLLIIETQRAYSKFSPRFLAWVIATCVNSTSVAVACLGLLVYIGVVVPVVSVVLTVYIGSVTFSGQQAVEAWFIRLSLIAVAVFAVVSHFRELKIPRLIYHLPRERVDWLMRCRPLRASCWLEFAGFELCVLVLSFFFTLMVSQSALLLVEGYRQVVTLW